MRGCQDDGGESVYYDKNSGAGADETSQNILGVGVGRAKVSQILLASPGEASRVG